MSKLLEMMSVEELSRYMKEHQDNHEKWQKAYAIFAQKSDWQEVPAGATWEEEKQFVEQFVSPVIS